LGRDTRSDTFAPESQVSGCDFILRLGRSVKGHSPKVFTGLNPVNLMDCIAILPMAM